MNMKRKFIFVIGSLLMIIAVWGGLFWLMYREWATKSVMEYNDFVLLTAQEGVIKSVIVYEGVAKIQLTDGNVSYVIIHSIDSFFEVITENNEIVIVNNIKRFCPDFLWTSVWDSSSTLMRWIIPILLIIAIINAIVLWYIKLFKCKNDNELALAHEDARNVSIHESGHAVVARVLMPEESLEKITIIKEGDSLGRCIRKVNSNRIMTLDQRKFEIAISYAGRIAERIILKEEISGSTQDYEDATNMAFRILNEGFVSNVLLTRTGNNNFDQFLVEKHYDEATKICEECYELAYKIIEKNQKVVKEMSTILLEKKELRKDDIEDFFKKNPLVS